MKHRKQLVAMAMAVALAFNSGAALAQQNARGHTDGVPTPHKSYFVGMQSAEKIERQSAQEFAQLKAQARAQGALAPDDFPPLQRLRKIADKLIPFAIQFSERYVDNAHPQNRAKDWKWEVNLIGSKQINAFCMPGGKIAFYTGILDTLKLTDDEIAIVMGHEISHAILEHGRERAAKGAVAQVFTIGASVFSAILGYGNLGGQAASGLAQVTLLRYSRLDESQADLVGMDIAARAGFDPRAGIVLWQKMSTASRGAPPQWMSTHPSNKTRIRDMEEHMNEVLPLYARASGRDAGALPPYTGRPN